MANVSRVVLAVVAATVVGQVPSARISVQISVLATEIASTVHACAFPAGAVQIALSRVAVVAMDRARHRTQAAIVTLVGPVQSVILRCSAPMQLALAMVFAHMAVACAGLVTVGLHAQSPTGNAVVCAASMVRATWQSRSVFVLWAGLGLTAPSHHPQVSCHLLRQSLLRVPITSSLLSITRRICSSHACRAWCSSKGLTANSPAVSRPHPRIPEIKPRHQ